MNHADATKNCPTCCIKNGLIWNNRWTNNSNRSFCQCTDHPTMNLLNDTNIIASPAMLSQMSAHVWGLGNMSILDCANYCADDKNCTFFTLDSNNACWNSDLNPVLAQKTFKSGIISGIKK
jgi:hypothetical protein